MEEIIAKLLVPDGNVIRQGTKELKEALKNVEAIPALCDLLVSAQRPDIRQTAAVILRRQLVKRSHWIRIKKDARLRIKQGLLEVVIKEEVKLVKNAMAQLIGVLSRHELCDNNWPQLLPFIFNLGNSNEINDRELGMYCLSMMTEMANDAYMSHFSPLTEMFTNILNNLPTPNCDLAYYTIITIKNLLPVSLVCEENNPMRSFFYNMSPRFLEIISASAICNENCKKVCDMSEIIEELLEYCPEAVVLHVNLIVEVCLRIGTDPQLNSEVRIKAVGVLGFLIRARSKALQSKRLIDPIIEGMMQVMSQKVSSAEDGDGSEIEDYYQGDEADEYNIATIATQTLDMIALHVASQKCIPAFLSRIEPALQGSDAHCQKAAYLALAVLAEGCSYYIKRNHLESFLNCVYTGINSPCVPVRNAALFALGQFAEHLQPEISRYASNLLPILLEQLARIYSELGCSSSPLPASLDRIFYALETFSENLEQALIPHLPLLMERLFAAIDPNHWSMQLKKLGFDAVSSAATAVKEGMLPYFPKILEIINVYVKADSASENYQVLSDALDCLAALGQNIGDENFKPLAQETLQLATKILRHSCDPDNRRAAFALVATLAIVMKEELAPVLRNIMPHLLDTIENSEGVETSFDEEEQEDAYDVWDDLDTTSDEEFDCELDSISDDDSERCKMTVANPYLDEKEQACLSLKEICIHVGPSFLPYFEKSFQEVFRLLNFRQDHIRRTALHVLQQLLIPLRHTPTKKQALYAGLERFIPKCAEIIRCDRNREMVMCALEAYSELLEKVKEDVLVGMGHRAAILNSVVDLFNYKGSCQENCKSNEHQESEQEELLIEHASEIIPRLVNVMEPADLKLCFPNIYRLFLMRTRKPKSESQRSCAYGSLAECIKPLRGQMRRKLLGNVLQTWFTGAADSNGEVRNNAIYGLGETVLYGKADTYRYYDQILQVLSVVLAKETHAGALDNICGAIAKLIIANSSLVPLEQVFPVFLERLPLRQDFQENEAVVNCVFTLYQQGSPVLRQHLAAVIKVLVHMYDNDQMPADGLKPKVMEFLKTMNLDFGEEFAHAVSSLGPAVVESVRIVLSS